MKTIVIGAGEVGYHIAERLSREEHDVVVIEHDPRVRARVQDELDVMTVEGNGSSPRVLVDAGVREASILIAVADIDEVNVVACLLAKEYGVATRIARVREPDFSESQFLGRGKRLGIDLLINPNIVVAEEILDLVKTPAAAEVGKFAEGKVLMLGIQVSSRAPILNRPLRSLRSFHTTTPFLIVAVLRHERLILPDGETILEEGDHIYFVSRRESVNGILTLLGKKESIVERVMVIGGGRMGLRVAQLLEAERFKVKLVEQRQERQGFLVHAWMIAGEPVDHMAAIAHVDERVGCLAGLDTPRSGLVVRIFVRPQVAAGRRRSATTRARRARSGDSSSAPTRSCSAPTPFNWRRICGRIRHCVQRPQRKQRPRPRNRRATSRKYQTCSTVWQPIHCTSAGGRHLIW